MGSCRCFVMNLVKCLCWVHLGCAAVASGVLWPMTPRCLVPTPPLQRQVARVCAAATGVRRCNMDFEPMPMTWHDIAVCKRRGCATAAAGNDCRPKALLYWRCFFLQT